SCSMASFVTFLMLSEFIFFVLSVMKVGSFTRTQEPNRNCLTGGTNSFLEAGTDGDGLDRAVFLAGPCARGGLCCRLVNAGCKLDCLMLSDFYARGSGQ